MAEELSDDDSSSDENLNVFSEKFDAAKALNASEIRLPLPDAPIYDNLSKFESMLKGVTIRPSSKKGSKSESAGSGEPSKRRFLPHQEAISTKKSQDPTAILERRNVLTKMSKNLGPLSMLHDWMQNRVHVKIYTRNAYGIRGYVEAYIAAFDKHWNLALEDCLETWTRKVRRKVPVLDEATKIPGKLEEDDHLIPKVVVKKRLRKLETLERHVPQLLLRGEQIVLIAKKS